MWRYVLKSRAKLNAVSGRTEFEGALLRIHDGFGCLHPWPELGDPGLGELLDGLREGRKGEPLLDRAHAMLEMDRHWRRTLKMSWLESLKVPRSHATIVELTDEVVEESVRRGFSVLKVKGRADFASVALRLDELSRRWPAHKWRIDFNGVLSKEETLWFYACLTEHARERIDFLEDPCPYTREDWTALREVTGFNLALDTSGEQGDPAAQYLVVKPARQDLARMGTPRTRFVVTSNMDHPLAQCYAAVQAGLLAKHRRVELCGLQTHELFEPTEFSERLGPAKPKFQSPGGTGLGFDDLLEKLPWKRLN